MKVRRAEKTDEDLFRREEIDDDCRRPVTRIGSDAHGYRQAIADDTDPGRGGPIPGFQ